MTDHGGIVLEAVSHRLRTGAGELGILHDVDLTISPGTSVAVVGPSGSGKSTLLGLMSGLAVPTSGRVGIDGIPIDRLSRDERARFRREHFGLVFQTGALSPSLTALENVGLQLALRGIPDDRARCVEVLTALGLADRLDRLPDQLSGGERQRVAVARALVHRPSYVLADEPTGSLDGENSRRLIDLLDSTRRAVGAALVVVTHDDDVARAMDRTVHLCDGRLVQRADEGPPGREDRA